MKNEKTITLHLDFDIDKQTEERVKAQKISVNRFIIEKELRVFESYFEDEEIIHETRNRVVNIKFESYFEDEEKKNNEEIESIKVDLKLIDYTQNNDKIKLRRAKLERRLLDCLNKIKILKEKKRSVCVIREEIEHLS